MNRFAGVLLVLAVASSQFIAKKECLSKEKWIEAYQKCKKVENITEETDKALLNKEIPESMDGKCFLACWLETLQLCTGNGGVEEGNAEAVCDAVCTKDKARGEKLRDALHQCSPLGENATGDEKTLRCEKAYLVSKCLKEKISEIWSGA